MRFFEHGSAYDDEAAHEGSPLPHRYLPPGGPPPEAARLVRVRFSPASSSRQILALRGRKSRGSLDFDLCRRCRRGHIYHFVVSRDARQLEARMLRTARATAPVDYRWTRSGLATRPQESWDDLAHDVTPAVPCEHLDWRPGRLRDAWACLRYFRLTGEVHLPRAKAEHRAVLGSKAARQAAPERLGAQLDQARAELAEAERRIAAAGDDRTELRRARKAGENAAARIAGLTARITALDR